MSGVGVARTEMRPRPAAGATQSALESNMCTRHVTGFYFVLLLTARMMYVYQPGAKRDS